LPVRYRVCLVLLLCAIAPTGLVRADATVTVRPVLEPGDTFDLVITRERSVDDDGHWLLEAKNQTFAQLRVLARTPDGFHLGWSVGRIVHQLAPGEPSAVAKKLGSIAEGLAFEVEADPAGRPQAIRDRGQVRTWLHAATDRVVDEIEQDLIAQGYPEAQVRAAGEAMRGPFHDLARAPDERFDRVWLRDLLTVLDLAGHTLPLGVEIQREAAGPVPMLDDRLVRLTIRERARLEAGEGKPRLLVERAETLAERVPQGDVLARFPALFAVITRMQPEQQKQALEELPPVQFERRTLWTIDPQTFVPLAAEREETLALGGLGRRSRALYSLTRAQR
jgi:hypothetical protein